MLKSSEFNSAVPKFTNGNYASNPIDPTNIEEPSAQDYVRGTEPLDTLPAQWWNWLCNQFTSRFNKLNTYVKNIFDELTQLLSLVNVTPDGTESTITTGQLKNAFKELYPTYVSNKLELGTTYVKKTQKVNNHALTGDITVTKSDVGLGNVPNVTTNNQTPTYTVASSLTNLTSGEVLSTAFGKIAKAVSSIISHIANVSNPHSVTKAQVGLGSVVNTGDSATPVENGTTKFTTGGAYTLKKDLTDIAESLPTDAVLHYSFDEVPDYPDGNADVRLIDNNTYDIQSTNARFRQFKSLTVSNSNGNAVLTATADSSGGSGAFINGSYVLNKIIKMKIKVTALSGTLDISNGKGTGGVILATYTTIGTYEFSLVVNSSAQYPNLYIATRGANESFTTEVLEIYIGDGSYSTPIIDNANGQNNATNNGGIAVQGVSGKGAYFPSATQNALIPVAKLPAPTSNSNITISLWIKFDADYPINETPTTSIVRIGQFQGLFGLCKGEGSIIFYARDSSTTRYVATPIEVEKWHNIVIVYNGTTHQGTLYDNGVLKGISEPNIANFQFGSNIANWYIWGNTVIISVGTASVNKKATVDDLLIFDRVLTETEVTALYQNKANTPKYYDINNYILDDIDSTPTQNSTNLVTSGGVYTELAKKVDKTTTVNGHALSSNVTVTKSDVGLGNVANVNLSNVVNTGDSATPISGGTTKFTTGGAYNLLTSLAPIFSTATSYAVGDLVTYNGQLYTCTTAHSAGAWNASHFTVANLNTELAKKFNASSAGDQVTYSLSGNTLTITSLS